MDFLGLKNFTMIEKNVSLINQSTGKIINIDDLSQMIVKLDLLVEEILKVYFNLNHQV